jgi:hypothetical protein
MGQKISPTSLRTGILKDWSSNWFGGRKYIPYLKDDLKVRTFLEKKLKGMGVADIRLERGSDVLNVIITTTRPGLLSWLIDWSWRYRYRRHEESYKYSLKEEDPYSFRGFRT